MATVSENLIALQNAKVAIKNAITAKGQDLSGVPFTGYASKINAIQGGEAVRSIKKYLEAGGTFGNQSIEDFRHLLEYSDTENLERLTNFFNRNPKLKYVPMLDFRKATTTYYMFSQCSGLVDGLPLYDFSNVGDFQGMFVGDFALKVVPAYDMRSAWSAGDMVNGCTNLEEIWVKNINVVLTVGSGSTYGHLLKVECLIHLIYELRYNKVTRTLTMGNVNLEKLANVYVRLVEITDEMRAEDDLIDEKMPFEVCESTDEGATQIVQYAKFKNWNIA